CLQYGTDPWTF
nr:immunoglobulin light chain junction region [Macaca mulatta]